MPGHAREKIDMKRLSLIMIASVFCLMVICPVGCKGKQDVQAAVRYKSKRIKIVRPAALAEKKGKVLVKESIAKAGKQVPAKPGAVMKSVTPVSAKSAAERIPPATLPPASLFKTEKPLYSRKGRIDPFAPFLHKPEPEGLEGGTEKTAGRVPRTPLERIPLGQLTLNAIIRVGDTGIALVQESSGRGYIVKVGTYIGENGGRVSKIDKDRIVIEEKSKNILGKIETKKIELKLKKQPGE